MTTPPLSSPTSPVPTPRRRYLDPMDRVSELLFGLIMVLTFTGTLSVADAGRETVREMLVAALGCNLAWGLVDGVMYLMACLAERGRAFHLAREVHGAADAAEGRRRIAADLPDELGAALRDDALEAVRRSLVAVPAPTSPRRLARGEWLGAVAVFLWVFVGTMPVVLPFVFVHDAPVALRASNGVALLMLYGTGYVLGKLSGRRPGWMGLSMLLIGVVLVALTIALGG